MIGWDGRDAWGRGVLRWNWVCWGGVVLMVKSWEMYGRDTGLELKLVHGINCAVLGKDGRFRGQGVRETVELTWSPCRLLRNGDAVFAGGKAG